MSPNSRRGRVSPKLRRKWSVPDGANRGVCRKCGANVYARGKGQKIRVYDRNDETTLHSCALDRVAETVALLS